MVFAFIPLRVIKAGDFDVLCNGPGELKRNLERKGLSDAIRSILCQQHRSDEEPKRTECFHRRCSPSTVKSQACIQKRRLKSHFKTPMFF